MLLAALFASAGCQSTTPINPSLNITYDQARDGLAEMADEPIKLDRPVIVVGGWIDWGPNVNRLAEQIRVAVGDNRVVPVPMFWVWEFDQCRDKLLDAVNEAYPSGSDAETVEVDVVAMSMGGLVARHAAAPRSEDDPGQRLKIARLYTISSPHQGANWSKLPTWDPLIAAMRPGSDFMRYIAATDASRDYPIVPYVRLGDNVVGVKRAAPPDQKVYWLANGLFKDSHAEAMKDPRIIADISRRLRDETPYATDPPAPLPD